MHGVDQVMQFLILSVFGQTSICSELPYSSVFQTHIFAPKLSIKRRGMSLHGYVFEPWCPEKGTKIGVRDMHGCV